MENKLHSFYKTLFAGLFLLLSVFGWGQIWENPITGTNPNTSNPYTTNQIVASNITVSGIGRGSGINGANANDRYNANNWNATFQSDDYFYFTITPNSGYKINFSSLEFVSQASTSNQPTNFSIRSSIDSYTANIVTFGSTGTTVDLSASAFQNVTSAISFRIYAWGGSNTGATYSINSFKFNGTILSVSTCAPPTLSSAVTAAPLFGNDYNFSGEVIDAGGGINVTERGFQISTANTMTSQTEFSENAGVGIYTLSGTTVRNTKYYYRAFAKNDCTPSEKGYSHATPVTQYFVTKQLSTTSNAATNVGSKSFQANWTDPSSGGGSETFTYKLVVERNDAGSWVNFNTYTLIPSNTPYQVVSGLVPNTEYRYRFYSVNEGGESDFPSNDIYVTTLPAATLLAYSVIPPYSGVVGSNLTTFKVAAKRADNSTDTDFTGSVTLTRTVISGAGNLAGTLSANFVNGEATFSAVNFDGAGTFTITASSTGLADVTSANINIVSGPCLDENFELGSIPSSWTTGGGTTNVNGTSGDNYVNLNENGEWLQLPTNLNYNAITFKIKGSASSNNWTLYVQTFNGTTWTNEGAGITGIGNTYTTQNINLSIPNSQVRLFLQRTGNSAYIGELQGFCGVTVSQPTDQFQAKDSGNWTDPTKWQSSSDEGVSWIDADLYPAGQASKVTIPSGKKITVNSNGIIITNTQVFGQLEIKDANFSVDGDDEVELTIENGGEMIVDGLGYKNIGDSYGLVKTGGTLTAGNTLTTSGFSENFVANYIEALSGLMYFEDAAICDWKNASRYPQSKDYEEFFLGYDDGDLPIFRISALPPSQGFGNTDNSNIINAIVELNTTEPFRINNATNQKDITIIGGIRGNGSITQNTGPGSGKIILGNTNTIPELSGNITINALSNRLQLPKGADVKTDANIVIANAASGSPENAIIVFSGGNINIANTGVLDITNMRIENTSSGSVIVNGMLRTRNSGGLYGSNSAMPSGNLTLNTNSTIEYYATVNQAISSSLNYYNLKFSGSGTKTPSNNVNVDTNGTITITGTPIVDFSTKNLASTSSNTTNLIMDGGRLKLGTTGSQPNMGGNYTLTDGVIEFTNTSGTRENIKGKNQASQDILYKNIEVTGTNVGQGNTNITLADEGQFTIKPNGIFINNDNAIVGPTGTQTINIENNATFRTGNALGFYGAAEGLNSPSIRNNIEYINFYPQSLVEYSRKTPDQSSGDQRITTPVSAFTPIKYSNLLISGNGTKTQQDKYLGVENTTEITGGEMVIPKTEENEDPYVFEAKAGLKINGGSFLLKNNAQLLQDAIVDNTGEIVVERIATDVNNDIDDPVHGIDYIYWSSPVSGQTLGGASGFSPGTNPNRIYEYKESNDTFVKSNDPEMKPGKGYAIQAETIGDFSNPYTKPYTFTGSPNNAAIPNVTVVKSTTEGGYNLIGNPYPTNISLDDLFAANTGKIYSTAWFWTNGTYTKVQGGSDYDGSNYAVYNNMGGNPATYVADEPYTGTPPNGIAKIGQGFIVQVSNSIASQDLVFNNGMRKPLQGEFFQKSNDKNRFWLQLTSPEKMVNTILVGYDNNATYQFETNYDGELFNVGSDALYAMLSDKKLAIQGNGAFTNTDKIVLGTRFFKNGNYTFSLNNPQGIFQNGTAIYLKDKELNTLTNLQDGSYTFAAQNGFSESRFEIVYQPQTTLSSTEANAAGILVYRSGDDFVIQSNQGNIEAWELYDASGRLQQTEKKTSKQSIVDGNSLSNGIYLLKIKANGKYFTKKILK